MLNFINLITNIWFKKLITFSGRSSRYEFWCSQLFLLTVAPISNWLIEPLVASSLVADEQWSDHSPNSNGIFTYLHALIVTTALVNIATVIRRLHDINRSGWWSLLLIIPVIGWLPLAIFLAKQGNQGDNSYGSDPLQLRQ